jgi:hypothetical protein
LKTSLQKRFEPSSQSQLLSKIKVILESKALHRKIRHERKKSINFQMEGKNKNLQKKKSKETDKMIRKNRAT